MNQFFVKKKSKRNSNWIFGILCVITVVSSCKEDTILPPDLVPGIDNINTFQEDTFSVITTTVYKDSLLTGGTLNTTNRNADADYTHAIGAITLDGFFGKSVAGAYFQVRPPAPKFEFTGTNRVIDSIVIGVIYKHAFGDTFSGPLQTFSLFRTTSNLDVDSAYYEFKDVPYTSADQLGSSISVDFNNLSTDSPIVNGVTLKPQIRFNIPGSSSFVSELEAQTATTGFLDYSAFTTWLGGFYIAPDANVGDALGYFDTYNAAMYIYYRFKDDNSQPDTAVSVFPFDATYCTRFNRITRDYNGSSAQSFIGTAATHNAPGDSLLFVQGEPGLASFISFPYIGQFPNSIINKAELTFTVVSLNNYMDTTKYNIPDRFQLVYVNDDGEDEILRDYLEVGTNRVGGARDLYTLAGLQRIQYKFNISNAVQEAVTTQNSNFRLKMSGARSDFPADKRVVLRGSGSGIALEKPKLNIIFTKIQR